MSAFKESLALGKTAETQVAKYLLSKGNKILPVYEIEETRFKGPVFHTAVRQLVAPDLLVFGAKKIFFAEVKRKSAFSWSRKYNQWETGIDLRHYLDYLALQDETEIPVWLFFLQCDGTAKDTPPGKISPTGLFVAPLKHLRCHEGHRKYGMVYWGVDSLRKLADYPLV